MSLSEPPRPPATKLLALDGTNLTRQREALATLSWSDFYTQLDDDFAGYRATADAVATFGHANITHMILRMTPHGDEGEAADELAREQVQLDRIPYAGFTKRLILLRHAGEPAVHALTETEYRAAMQQLAR